MHCPHQCWYFPISSLICITICITFSIAIAILGRIEAVNQYLDTLPIKTNDEGINLMRIKSGVENLTMISAKDIPGVLMQVNIAICITISYILSNTICIEF
jgi:hypothetical protein